MPGPPFLSSVRSEGQPGTHRSFSLGEGCRIKGGDATYQFRRRHGADALGIEASRIKSPGFVDHFKPRAPEAGGSRHLRDQGAFMVEIGHAENDGRTYFLRQAKIDQPDVAALYFGACH